MAMVTYDKRDLVYRDGYVWNGSEIVAIDNEVVDLFNKLEDDLQRAVFNEAREDCAECAAKAMSAEFARASEHTISIVDVHTPVLDAKVDEAKAFMAELDGLDGAEKSNKYLSTVKPLVLWCNDKFVVDFSEQGRQHRFDLPTIGNPLEIDGDGLCIIVARMFGGEV